MGENVNRIMRIFALAAFFTCFTTVINAQTQCPVVDLTGPAGLTPNGEIATFVASTNPVVQDAKFEWTVSAGTIEKGQDTLVVEVRMPAVPVIGTVTVQVKVSGMPDGCADTSSETIGIGGKAGLATVDDYGDITADEEARKLDVVAFQAGQKAGSTIVVVVSKAKKERDGTIETRIARIRKHLTSRNIPSDRVTFIRTTHEVRSTKIYLV